MDPSCAVQKYSQLTSIAEEVKYRYDETNIKMPVFMGDLATADKAEHVRKGINNCAKMEKENVLV